MCVCMSTVCTVHMYIHTYICKAHRDWNWQDGNASDGARRRSVWWVSGLALDGVGMYVAVWYVCFMR
jgi:hypothetical protein